LFGGSNLPYYCLECGGKLTYDVKLKQYICTSCGITFSFQQLFEEREKIIDEKMTKDDEKKKKQKEYLKWWLSKKD
jgi:hypothetical protein